MDPSKRDSSPLAIAFVIVGKQKCRAYRDIFAILKRFYPASRTNAHDAWRGLAVNIPFRLFIRYREY